MQIARFVVDGIAPRLDQKLYRASLYGVRFEGVQPVRVGVQEIQNQGCIAGVALGSGGIYTLAMVIQCVGVDWIENQMLIFAEHEYKDSAALLQCHGYPQAGKPDSQSRNELLNCFGRMVQISLLDFGLAVDTHRPAVFLICPINAQPDGCSFLCHRSCPFSARAALFPRRPYSRVWLLWAGPHLRIRFGNKAASLPEALCGVIVLSG